jgi:hypothetical protein
LGTLPTLVLPTISSTTAISSIKTTAAISGGSISSDGGAPVTARGVCWSTVSAPTINDSKTTDGIGISVFTSNLTGLTLGQTYYVRAYATNSVGTAYGNEVSFTTALGIGDYYQGGKIVYILQSGDTGYISGEVHGIIAALSDQSVGAPWSIGSYPGTTLTAFGTGNENTIALVASQGDEGIYAAKLCADYVNTDTGTGVYSDWYLPSKDELTKCFASSSSADGLLSKDYWSSSYDSGNSAWGKWLINDHNPDSMDINSLYPVRAVRSF